jgi:bifunctional non-homologous end joining protein LigD
MCARPTQPLGAYRAKRNFAATPEPAGDEVSASQGPLAYVIQKHAATRLHYDLRLEHGGVMWSWAVPKGPSYDPTDKRVAIKTEDHPISYNSFEGTIPKGQYGAGTVIVWDRGSWEPVGDPAQGLAAGKLLFTLHGQKLHGQWELVRIKPKDNERQDLDQDRSPPAGLRRGARAADTPREPLVARSRCRAAKRSRS